MWPTAEASAIRRIGFGADGRVTTIVGTGLFDFGDRDGTGSRVRLQHPLGLSYVGGVLYVADTYNDKIKRIDPQRRSSTSFVGGHGELEEPGGLSAAGGKLYVADTNHHEIKVWIWPPASSPLSPSPIRKAACADPPSRAARAALDR